MGHGLFDLGSGQDFSKKQASKKKQGCDACKLYKDCDNPELPLYGTGKHKILFVALQYCYVLPLINHLVDAF